jgi:hypothetical protein
MGVYVTILKDIILEGTEATAEHFRIVDVSAETGNGYIGITDCKVTALSE